MATQWWNPFDGDVIPGINVGAAYRRVTGDKSRGDEDIVEGLSVRGGARSPVGNALVGRTAVPARTGGGNTQTGLADTFVDANGNVVGGGGGGGTGFSDAYADGQAAAKIAKEEAERNALRAEIGTLNPRLMAAFQQFMQQLDSVAGDRRNKLEKQYGDQLETITGEYTNAIPTIENSFAALGAGDSTDRRDGKIKAKEGFDKGVETVGNNKRSDETKIGEYVSGEKAKYGAVRDKASRLAKRAGDVEDVSTLRDYRNNIEDTIGDMGVARGSIATEKGALGTLNSLTADKGRFDEVSSAVQGILGSSMAGATKEAALTALSDKAGLSDGQKAELDKKKSELYGDAYAAQAVA